MDEKILRKIIREELATNMVPKLLTNAEAAELLCINSGTLSNWRTVGRGPKPTNVGGNVRYQLSEINSWLKENTMTGMN